MMKVFGIGLVVVVLGGAGWFILSGPQTSDDAMVEKTADTIVKDEGAMMEEKGDVMMKDGNAMMEKKDDASMMEQKDDAMMMAKKGSYEAYAPEKLSLATSGDIVLFFRASWCPTCRAADADIRAHADDIPSTLTILDVNYDTATTLKQKYGVTYQHTFVQVDAQGNLIKKWSSSPTLAAIVAEVK